MAFNSSGEVSYLVLDSLSKDSKYGLEIIEYISQKTGGHYIMKKPTLYSCLTRMEKKGYVSSSFWGESDLGGKRHYYSITSSGKQELQKLSAEFENSTFEDLFSDEPAKEQPSQTVVLQQDNLFDLAKKDAPASVKEEQEPTAIENQMDMFSMQQQDEDSEKMQYYQTILEQDTKEVKDDAHVLDESEVAPSPVQEQSEPKEFVPVLTEDQEAQNQKLYEELKKIRKKKSFSENQIEMSVVYETEEDKALERERLEELKRALLASKKSSQEEFRKQETPQPQKAEDLAFTKEHIAEKEDIEEVKDDAVYITAPIIQEHEIPIQKRITPPNIEVNVYDDNLPAPKRNSNLEPTYKDMMAKLFERKKEVKKAEPKQAPESPVVESENYSDVDSFVDYSSLKRYYSGHGIEFKEYKKSVVERSHNTNFLNFLNSLFMLCLSGITSAILFGIISACNALQPSSNFLFYTVPILFFVYCIYAFVRFEVEPSKKPNLKYKQIAVWSVFVVAVVAVFVIDIICGMQFETMRNFVTAILVPIFSLAIALPANFYARKFLYNRFGK